MPALFFALPSLHASVLSMAFVAEGPLIGSELRYVPVVVAGRRLR